MKPHFKITLLLAALFSTSSAWADVNGDKIQFVKKLYAEAKRTHSDSVLKNATGKLKTVYQEVSRVEQKIIKQSSSLDDYYDALCLGGVPQMFGGGQDIEYNVKRDYSVDKQGRVRVSFKQFQFAKADRIVVYYTLQKVGSQYKVADMEINVSEANGKSKWRTKSYQASLQQCLVGMKKQFKVK